MSLGYIYLLQPLRSIKDNQKIYKIGKTTRNNFKRFNEYPIGSILLLQSSCNNCDLMEKHLLKLFNEKFVKETNYGREYFNGDLIEMKKLINSEIINEENIVNYDNNNVTSELQNSIIDDMVSNDEIDEIYDEEPYDIKSIKQKFSCEKCNYTSSRESQFIRHCLTEKHKNLTDFIKSCKNVPEKSLSFTCNKCNKNYKSRMGLWQHAKKCSIEHSPELVVTENQDTFQIIDSGVVLELIKQNKELQNVIVHQSETINKLVERTCE